jgi:hypothetical protein
MTANQLPAVWASQTNYSSGPDNGTPTKVDPASAGNGFIRGTAISPQHVNFLIERLTRQSRRSFTINALRLRELRTEGTPTTVDTAESMAGVSGRFSNFALLAIKADQAMLVSDCDRLEFGGAMASITDNVVGAARNGAGGARVIAVGDDGGGETRAAFTTNEGGSWTATGAPGLLLPPVAGGIVWNGTRFIVLTAADSIHSTDGAAWTLTTAGQRPSDVFPNGAAGLAALTGGKVIALGAVVAAADVKFAETVDNGSTWQITSGTVPTPTSYAEPGSIAGNGGSLVYHCGRLGGVPVISSSSDGDTWSVIHTSTLNATGAPRILMCQDTGLLVVVSPDSVAGRTGMIASLDGGVTWSDPMYAASAPVESFALAGGRLFHTRDEGLFASDGVGLV